MSYCPSCIAPTDRLHGRGCKLELCPDCGKRLELCRDRPNHVPGLRIDEMRVILRQDELGSRRLAVGEEERAPQFQRNG